MSSNAAYALQAAFKQGFQFETAALAVNLLDRFAATERLPVSTLIFNVYTLVALFSSLLDS